MVDYSKWQSQSLRVVDLKLDPENPRIPPSSEPPTQPELIHLFCQHYRIYDLAESIAQDGYFPDERIVVFEENATYVVLEGNRRVTALKVLISPEVSPGEMQQRFIRLSNSVNRKSLSHCDAIIAPSREQATKLILEKHTQPSVLKWSPLMQAEFYHKLVQQGSSTKEIAQAYNLSASSIQSFLRMSFMYHVAASLPLSSEIKTKVLDPQEFPISVLERIYDNSEARKQLTLSDDLSSFSCSPEQIKQALMTIVTDIVTGAQDSRTLNTSNDIRNYANQVTQQASIRDMGRQTKTESIMPAESQQGQASSSLNLTGVRKNRSTREPRSLFGASDIPFRLKGASSLRRFYDELRELRIKTFPNTTAILFRVFVEKACRHFLKRKGIKSIDIGKKALRLADVQFGDLLDFLADRHNEIIGDENTKKAIRTFKSSSTFKSLSSLNTIVHNEEVTFAEEQVRELYPNLEALLKIVLAEEKA